MSEPVTTAGLGEPTPVLELRGITKHFGGVTALHAVDLKLNRQRRSSPSSATTAPASRP